MSRETRKKNKEDGRYSLNSALVAIVQKVKDLRVVSLDSKICSVLSMQRV